MKKVELDKNERELVESFERGEWKPVSDLKSEVERHRGYARNTLRKDRRVNIRISSKDLELIQSLAAEDGIPYQTLMASVLHRYASGTLVHTGSRTTRSTVRTAARP